MKKWLCAAGLGLALAASASVQAADKIAVVNVASSCRSVKPLPSSWKTSLKAVLPNCRKWKAICKPKCKNCSVMDLTMKASDLSKAENDLMAQREQFSNKAQAFEQDNRRRQMEERNKILSRIQDAIKSVASKEGYDIVIDANAVAYVGNAKDITADVLKQVK